MKPKAIIVSGYFNPLHKGHLELFEKAKDLLYQKALINSVRLIGISINNLNLLKKEKRPSIKRKNSQLSLPF